jgi:gamma-glutamylcyclotransferase (GGCT)/AIG2-like uncharacterized protein YtfP
VTCWYFAYGSNMNPARVSARGLRYETICSGLLSEFRLTFDKQSRDHQGSGHANVAAAPSSRVEGVLYRLCSPEEIARMDPFENAPVNYRRERVRVAMGDTAARVEVDAWTYIANPAVLRAGLRPERAYLAHLLAGRPYLSDNYFAWLSSIACADE